MIENEFFKKHFVGRDGFFWWIGQIASDSWKANIPGSRKDPLVSEDQPGFGYRYQVRIMGYHTADPEKLTDDQLPWAAVMYPVTSGGGGDATFETPALRKGNFVYGFFIDGEDAQQPVIMGILGYNQYQAIYKEPPRPFTPFRGYPAGSRIPRYAILTEPETNLPIPNVSEEPDNEFIGTGNPNTAVNNNATRPTESSKGKEEENLDLPYVCDESKSPGAIQRDIAKMIQDIQNAVQGLNDFKKSITHPIQFEGKQLSIQEYISLIVDRGAKSVTKWLKDRIAGAEEWVVRKINNGLKDFYFILFPDKQSDAKAAVETAMDLLACFFRRIIKNLLNIVRKALLSLVDKVINVGICLVENFLGAILGKLIGIINSVVSAILKPLEVFFGAIDLAIDVLGFVEQILSFLSCEEKPTCPELESWSLWDGGDYATQFDPGAFIEKVKKFAGTVTDAIDPDNFDFDFDFGDLLSDTSCITDAFPCGPPSISFFGGSGSGASGNAIISAAGEIIGVDIVNSGSGYSNAPIISFVDDCGNGSGATAVPVIGRVSPVGIATTTTTETTTTQDATTVPDFVDVTTQTTVVTNTPINYTTTTTTTAGQNNTVVTTTQTTLSVPNENVVYLPDPNGTELGIVGVIITNPGTGYLSVPNGSQGGDGRVWATPNQTVVKRSDGTWEVPYNPGQNINLLPGDIIKTPIGSSSEIINQDGENELVPGGVNYPVNSVGTLTAPVTDFASIKPGAYPIKNTNQYPVILYLCDAIITNSGYRYSEGDKIIIEPSNGAEMIPTFNELGQLTSVKITSGGEGFQEIPRIYIESDTGFNAEITPRFCIDRVGVDELKTPSIQDKIVSVVDCVGKV